MLAIVIPWCKLIARAKDARANLAAVLRQTAQQVWGGRSTELVRIQTAVDDANTGYRARAAIPVLMVVFTVPIAALGLVGAVTHDKSAARIRAG